MVDIVDMVAVDIITNGWYHYLIVNLFDANSGHNSECKAQALASGRAGGSLVPTKHATHTVKLLATICSFQYRTACASFDLRI